MDDDTLVDEAIRLDGDQTLQDPVLEELWARGTRGILDRAVQLTCSSAADARWLGVEILRNLGLPDDYAFQTEVIEALTRLAAVEQDNTVLHWSLKAMCDRHDPRALPSFLAHATHPDLGVRRIVACGLTSCMTDDVPTAVSIVEGLIRLSRDPDDAVRGWATDGLGQSLFCWEDLFDPSELAAFIPDAVRTLHERLDDPNPAIRLEALRGLALRRHPDALAAIAHELLQGDQTAGLTAAIDLADERLRPILELVEPAGEEQEALLAEAFAALEPGAAQADQ